MRGLTLTQPWASLVAIGAKAVETRSWGTSYRGPIAIHAAKGYPAEAQHFALDSIATTALIVGMQRHHLPYRHTFPDDLPRGAIVAVARLANVLPIEDYRNLPKHECIAIDDEGFVRVWMYGTAFGHALHVGDIQLVEHEAAFGDYTPGRFGWLLEDVRPLAEPVVCRGNQGLWNVPATIASDLAAVTGET
jgi:hypothetical protein